MPRTVSERLRRLWLNLHLWLGVGLLLVLAPLGVSGSILVWHDPLDRTLHAERYAVSRGAERPMAVYATAARQAFVGRAALMQIRAPAAPGDPVVAVGRIVGPPGAGGRPRTLNAWIDPPTGRVLATAEVAGGFTMVLHRFHGSLLAPGVGRKIVGWLGWALFASSATGLWLWWPRRGSLLRALHWRRGASQLFNLHHAMGFWLCLPLAVLSLTGVVIAFPQMAQCVIAPDAAPTAQRPRDAAPPLAAPGTALAEALGAAQRLSPNARVAAVNWPQAGRHPTWRIELRSAPAPTTVTVDDASGRAEAAAQRRQGPDPRLAWLRGVHDGSRLGPVWRGVICIAGLAPALLGFTGLIMWLRRRGRERRLRDSVAGK